MWENRTPGLPFCVCMLCIGSHSWDTCTHACTYVRTKLKYLEVLSRNKLEEYAEDWKYRFFFSKSGEWRSTAIFLPPLFSAGRLVKDQEDVWSRGSQVNQTEGAQMPVMESLFFHGWSGGTVWKTDPITSFSVIHSCKSIKTSSLIDFSAPPPMSSLYVKLKRVRNLRSGMEYELTELGKSLELWEASETRSFTFCYFVLFLVNTLHKLRG